MSETPTTRTKQELRTRMQHGLTQFLSEIDQLSDAQMLEPMDATGWNVRDHVTHLAVWAEGMAALLRREDRYAAMGVVLKTVDGGEPDYDLLNQQIAERHRHRSPAEVRAWLVVAHEGLLKTMDALTEAELAAPYATFVAPYSDTWGDPISEYILGNTEDHYDEHTPWIRAIVAGNTAGRS